MRFEKKIKQNSKLLRIKEHDYDFGAIENNYLRVLSKKLIILGSCMMA